MHFVEETVEQLERLKHAGVKLSMDDFGSGYSSLGYLKRFKIDTLKIDQMLVHDIVEDRDDRAIADAIIKMGHSLGLTVVAEGVETREQFELLGSLGCDAMQGFYFDRALEETAFVGKYLRRDR
jgi:EAL domain-containing protein (putative c-di-GMP-specific phosphodiesterase class I)